MHMSSTSKLLSIKQLIKAGGLPGYLLLFNNILIFFVKRRRSLEEYSSIDNSALIQIGFTFLIFVLAFHALFFKSTVKKKLLFLNPNKFLLLFIVICFLSVFWTPNLSVTLYRAFESLTYLMLISWIVYNLSTRLDFQNIIEWVVFWAFWNIIWSLAVNLKLGGLGSLAYVSDVARLSYPVAIFFALFLSKRKFFKYIILILAFFSFSNKIYIGFVMGMLALLFGDSKNKALILSLIIFILGLLFFIDFETILKSTIFIGREEISINNTSGRDKLWQIAWEAFKDSPIVGYGFVSGENAILYDKFKGAISTHSFLFSGLLGTGLLGTVFLVLYYFSIFKIGFNTYWPKNKWKVAIIGTLIMSFVLSLTAPGVGGRVYGSWVPVVFVITVICSLNYKFKAIKNKIPKWK